MSELLDCPHCGQALMRVGIRWTYEYVFISELELLPLRGGGVAYGPRGSRPGPGPSTSPEAKQILNYQLVCSGCGSDLDDIPWQLKVDLTPGRSEVLKSELHHQNALMEDIL